jgi:hypothetical protein
MKYLSRVILLLVILTLIVSLSVVYKTENFQNFPSGFDPQDKFLPWDSELTTGIVGPNPNSPKLETWQYRPDRTLVDYKFYHNNERMEPTANADIGKIAISSTTKPVNYLPAPVDTNEHFFSF